MHLIGLYCPCTRQQDLARLSENGLLPTSKRKNVVRFQTFITRIPLFVPSHFYSTRATKEALASLVIPFQGTFSAWIYMNKLQLQAWTFFYQERHFNKVPKIPCCQLSKRWFSLLLQLTSDSPRGRRTLYNAGVCNCCRGSDSEKLRNNL